ncbi:MAG: hypothetical protein ACYC2H_00600 [Thermoplasmatota archaeon]
MHQVTVSIEGLAIQLTCDACKASKQVPADGMAWVEDFNAFVEDHRGHGQG